MSMQDSQVDAGNQSLASASGVATPDARGFATLPRRLQLVVEASRLPAALVERFGVWITTSADEDLYRVNVLKWASEHDCSEGDAIDLFLHATHVGILDMSWGVVCHLCAMLITTPGGMRGLGPKSTCKL